LQNYSKTVALRGYKPPLGFAPSRLDTDDILVMGNVGDNSVGSYRLHASETQQLADTTPVCYLCGVSRQPMTGRLATQRLRDRFTTPEDKQKGNKHWKRLSVDCFDTTSLQVT